MQTQVLLPEDRFEEVAGQFARAPIRTPFFINSIPKGGTHLIRNILRTFVPHDQQWHRDFIQLYNLKDNLAAFDPTACHMSWGHLFHEDTSLVALRGVKHIVLARDPYSWVLARARFFLADQTRNPLDHLRRGAVPIEEILTVMILGIINKTPSLGKIYEANICAWLGGDAYLVRYEDIVRHVGRIDTPAAESFFAGLLRAAGIETLPDDWRARVLAGAQREYSGTARENLSGDIAQVPEVLPDRHKALIDLYNPGLRAFLGYA